MYIKMFLSLAGNMKSSVFCLLRILDKIIMRFSIWFGLDSGVHSGIVRYGGREGGREESFETENPDFPGPLYTLLYLWLRRVDGTTSGEQINSTRGAMGNSRHFNSSAHCPLDNRALRTLLADR